MAREAYELAALKKKWQASIYQGLSAGTGWTMALVILGAGLMIHLWLATIFPLSNDESYYWDWGQKLQLSYYDHPPGISWVTAINAHLGSGLLAVRLLVPFMQALASFFMLLCLREIHPQWRPRDFLLLSLATVLLPGFSLLGIFALPDAGLYPCISAALFLTLRFRSRETLGLVDGLLWGALLGLAGVFKYHALPIGAGMGLALLFARRSTFKADLGFWCSVLVAGLTMTLPVWIWNIQNDWASIRYQTEHGMGGLQLQWSGGLRTMLGILLFVTPAFAIMLLLTIKRMIRNPAALPEGVTWIILGSSLPVLLLVGGVSFFKPVLLHWLMPGLWLLLPAWVYFYSDRIAQSKRTWVLAFLLSIVLPAVLSNRSFRHSLLTHLGDKAGAIMELTVWNELNATLQVMHKTPDFAQPEACPKEGYLAGQRWYSVSQLHFLNKQKRPTISLDRGNPSYYSFRDAKVNWVGCAVTLVIAERNFRQQDYTDLIEIMQVEKIPLQLHASQKYLAINGRLIAPPSKVLKLVSGP